MLKTINHKAISTAIFTNLQRISIENNIPIGNGVFNANNLEEAIKNNIALYAMHTNLDNILNGVNSMICKKLKIKNTKILLPKNNTLKKIITFCITLWRTYTDLMFSNKTTSSPTQEQQKSENVS